MSSAQSLAAELALPLAVEAGDFEAVLRLDAQGLSLAPQGKHASGPVSVDFAGGGMRHRRRGGKNEPLGRAVGTAKWPGLEVVDATAGLGRDSFVLADLGARLTLVEQNPIIHALLRDGLARGQDCGDEWVEGVCRRMRLVLGDARDWLTVDSTDVVYLDPMFPARRKSARVKKEMWLFQQLLEEPPPSEDLLEAALGAARRRVVVKRPAKAPPLADRSPGFEIPGKTVRFDVYLP